MSSRVLCRVAAFALVLAGLVALPARCEASTFSVDTGDTLYSVARRNGIPLWVLESSNPHLVRGKLLRGDRLVLPKRLVFAVCMAFDRSDSSNLANAYPFAPSPSRDRSVPAGDERSQHCSPLRSLTKRFKSDD